MYFLKAKCKDMKSHLGQAKSVMKTSRKLNAATPAKSRKKTLSIVTPPSLVSRATGMVNNGLPDLPV